MPYSLVNLIEGPYLHSDEKLLCGGDLFHWYIKDFRRHRNVGVISSRRLPLIEEKVLENCGEQHRLQDP